MSASSTSTSTSAAPIATREQWSEQSPALIAHRTIAEDQLIQAAKERQLQRSARNNAAAGSKRKAASRRKDVNDDEEMKDAAADQNALGHLRAPCFAAIPASALASSTPAPSAYFTAPLPALTKKARKAIKQDIDAYQTSLNAQTMRVLTEAIPRAIVRLQVLESEFEEKMVEPEQLTASASASEPNQLAQAYHFESSVREALTRAAEKVGQQPTRENATQRLQSANGKIADSSDDDDDSSDDDDGEPITSLFQHTPGVHSQYPPLSSAQSQGGWTSYHPARAHAIHTFNQTWLKMMQHELSDFISVLALLKTSFTLALPQAGDHDNVTSEIYEEYLTEVKSHMEWAHGLRHRLTSYNEQRAKLLSKVYKYPGIQDYQISILELDSYIRITIHLNWITLRNGYHRMYLLYERNEEKLRVDDGDQDMRSFNSMI